MLLKSSCVFVQIRKDFKTFSREASIGLTCIILRRALNMFALIEGKTSIAADPKSTLLSSSWILSFCIYPANIRSGIKHIRCCSALYRHTKGLQHKFVVSVFRTTFLAPVAVFKWISHPYLLSGRLSAAGPQLSRKLSAVLNLLLADNRCVYSINRNGRD